MNRKRDLKISIVVPAYNSENHIKKTIKSILNQTYSKFELIIVDDGSTDNTRNIINSIKDNRIIYYYQKNSGVSKARNTGVDISNGDYIAFLDSDDIWENNFLEECINAINVYPNINLFCTRIQCLRKGVKTEVNSKKILSKVDKKLYLFNYYDIAYIQPLVSMSSVIIRKEAFLNINGFNIESYSGEDHELYGKLGLEGEFCLINEILAYYNLTSNGGVLRKSCKPPLVNFIDCNIKNCYKEKRKKINKVKYKFLLDYINGLIRRNESKKALVEIRKNYKILLYKEFFLKYMIYIMIAILPNRLRLYVIKKIF